MKNSPVEGFDIGVRVQVINPSSSRSGQTGVVSNVLHVCDAYWSVHVKFKDQSKLNAPYAYAPKDLEIVR